MYYLLFLPILYFYILFKLSTRVLFIYFYLSDIMKTVISLWTLALDHGLF